MKNLSAIAAVSSAVSLCCSSFAEPENSEGDKIQQDVVIEKSLELTSRVNRWLKVLGAEAAGYTSNRDSIRLLYGVDPEYDTMPSYSVLAEVVSRRVLLTFFDGAEITTAKTDLTEDEWRQFQRTLDEKKVWEKAKFYELMLAESKSSSVWMIEYRKGPDTRLFLTERLDTNAIHSDDGSVPPRKEIATMFSNVFGKFPVETLSQVEFFKNLPLQYPKSWVDEPFPGDQPSNKSRHSSPDRPESK